MKSIKDRKPVNLGVHYDPDAPIVVGFTREPLETVAGSGRPRILASIERRRVHFLTQLNRHLGKLLPLQPRFLELISKPIYVIVDFSTHEDVLVHLYVDNYEQRGQRLLIDTRKLYAVNSYPGKLVYNDTLKRVMIQRLPQREEPTLFSGNHLATFHLRAAHYTSQRLDYLFGTFRNPA